MDQIVRQAARLIAAAKHLVVFTGAGISVECGIPPFRGPGGLWSKVDPRLATRSYFLRHPAEVWDFWRERFFSGIVAEARPGPAHQILARWEARGLVKAVITQNVDSLHRKAGSTEVMELHGSCRDLRCEQCGTVLPAASVDLRPRIPRCPGCGTGLLRPDLVMFEEQLPQRVWAAAAAQFDRADVVLIIGTSGEVYPAAELPRRAAVRGAGLVRIDPGDTTHAPAGREIHLRCGAAEGMSALEARLREAGPDKGPGSSRRAAGCNAGPRGVV